MMQKNPNYLKMFLKVKINFRAVGLKLLKEFKFPDLYINLKE